VVCRSTLGALSTCAPGTASCSEAMSVFGSIYASF
jgi:hypothetical protein